MPNNLTTGGSRNPKNKTNYARRRSIWKWGKNLLDDLNYDLLTRQMKGGGYCAYDTVAQCEQAWGTTFSLFTNIPEDVPGDGAPQLPEPVRELVPRSLLSDFRLIWPEFCRIVTERAVDYDFWHPRTAQLIILATTPTSFDLVYSKTAITKLRDRRGDPHFYHWQAVLGLPEGRQGILLDDEETG